jgi:hypothetical protein
MSDSRFQSNVYLRCAVLWLLAGAMCGIAAQPPAFGATTSAGASSTQGAQGAPHGTQDSTHDAPQAQSPAEMPAALPKGKKLFLTDGTFQIVREYQRQGDRVRYYSVERSAWEEIPAALVDWAATQKAEADQQTADKELTQKIAASERAVRIADIDSDRSYEVRPGIILPDEAGLYALDGNAVVPMVQNLAGSRLDKGRTAERIITGVPLIPSKAHIEIPGKSAKLRLHSGDPEFYFRTADRREPAVALLRADIKGDKRELETTSTNIVGQVSYKGSEQLLLLWEAASGLYRLTVEQDLQPGEYALVERTAEGVQLYVWDFGVDGGAPSKGNVERKKP